MISTTLLLYGDPGSITPGLHFHLSGYQRHIITNDTLVSHADGLVRVESGRLTFAGENGLGEKLASFSKELQIILNLWLMPPNKA